MKFIYIGAMIFLLGGCSFKSPDNNWQYKSTSAFGSYQKNFLGAKEIMAKNDLKRAIAHAKVSADLTTLARVYLGECALNIAVGLDDECSKYKDIRDVVNDTKLDAYYAFLTNSLKEEDIKNLPEVYQNYSWHVRKGELDKANEDIQNIEVVSSQLIAFSLLKDKYFEIYKSRFGLIQVG